MWRSSAEKLHALVDRRLLLLLHLETERDVLPHLHVREDGVALEDHRDATSPRRQVRRVAVADVDAALVDPLQPGEAAEQGRLAAADGPSSTMNSRSLTSRSTPSTAANLPKFLRTPWNGSQPLRALRAGTAVPRGRPSSGHAPPGREQVLADDEDDDERGSEQEEPPARRYGSGDVSSAASI